MAKPKEIQIEGYPFFCWEYEPQTKMKHIILEEYIVVWAQKLGKYNNLAFFDCNGGCGAYAENGEVKWGSSVILADIVKKLSNKKMKIFVCEKNKKYYENLISVLEYKGAREVVKIANGKFEDIVFQTSTLEYCKKHPSFFFVDPFGYSVNINDLIKLINLPKSEMMFNFMYNFINRSVSIASEENNLNNLFGCSDWKRAKDLSGIDREHFIVNLFKEQIKKKSGVKYVFPYKISFYDKNRTYYYLFHITNHYDGISIMKHCFAKHNFGKVEYLGKRNGELTLFDLDGYVMSEIKEYLCRIFNGKQCSFEDICSLIIDDTMYLESDIRKALQDMRKEKEIFVQAITSKTERGLSGKDLVIFPNEGCKHGENQT